MPFEPRVAGAAALYAVLLILPGLAVLAITGLPRVRLTADGGEPARPVDFGVRLGLAAAIGLALQPLIYLWAHLVGLPLGAWFWAGLLAMSAAALAGQVRAHHRRAPEVEPPTRPIDPAHAALIVILAGTLISRWWAARELVVPSWGDSVHHTLIVRLFTLHAGLVDNWLPFAPLSSFSYHFGFHASVASLVALSGMSEPQAVIISGQVLMVLQVLTAYALVAGITGRPWAGVGAALAAAGLSTMPAYYVNWGRYTQLAGQVILPAALLATIAARRWRGMVPGAILVAGLALTHYIVTAFFVLGCLAWLIMGAGPWARAGWPARLGAAGRMIAVGAGAALLALPWVPQFAAGPLGGTAVALATTRVSDPNVYGVAPLWATWGPDAVGRNIGWGLVIATALGLVWGILRSERTVAFGAAWIALLVLAAYPSLFGLPVTGVLKDAVIALGLYVPAGVIVGGALGDAARAWRGRDVAQPENALVRAADVQAMSWLRENTPPESVFLVSSFPAFGDTVLAGDDAGWWLPLLAEGRRTTLPPITYGIERSVEPGYRLRVNRLAELWRADLDAEATRAALAAAGVTHAYVGVTAKALDRAKLAASPYWEEIYAADGVQVFAFLDAAGTMP